MGRIKTILLDFRNRNADLQQLSAACGPSASRSPPLASSVDKVRNKVAKALKLSPSQGSAHHPASPWKFALVRRVLEEAGDPDLEIARWLRDGTPVGIAEPIRPSGLLPLISESRGLSVEDLRSQVQWTHNHPSFDAFEAPSTSSPSSSAEPPAHALLADLVNEGYALLFSSRDEAAAWLGTEPVPSPLGDVVKLKPDGTFKHRLIQDLRASCVNSASTVPERQVLPRFTDHARDIALASQGGHDVGVFIIDFSNAFMTLPLAAAEQPFNTSVAPHQVVRTRAPLHPSEPQSGSFLVWRVLGFGGHSNPLTYSRVASFAARSAQALLMQDPNDSPVAQGRLQLYVDDPALTLRGTPAQQQTAVDIVLLWWLCLGIPLAWPKGSFMNGREAHEWIGVRFWSPVPGAATMSVSGTFLESLLEIALKFSSTSPRTATLRDAHLLCGKAGRLAQVVPAARPFVGQLFAALAASLRSLSLGLREAPPRKVAKRRFRTASSWLVGLLRNQPFRLEHTIFLTSQLVPRDVAHVEFDASPWGGAFVYFEGHTVMEYGVTVWDESSARHLGIVPELPKWQTFWELATPRPWSTSVVVGSFLLFHFRLLGFLFRDWWWCVWSCGGCR